MIPVTKRPLTVQRVLAPVLATLLMVLSVAVPVLDAGEKGPGAVVESEHNPSTCVRGHDHTICTQLGASHGYTSEAPRHGGGFTRPAIPRPLAIDDAAPSPAFRDHHSRAPPVG